ncbi:MULTISPECIES: sensor histidine kinase [unclassified Phenylobacterium]|uniref:sensor histidine kinase n=1 Tax=unclassified Phenylobacterium TaxID=2640670 RepID=UPI0009E96970|nr:MULTISPECIES: sensor histidine kinase [unclassified Phenylobacterium]
MTVAASGPERVLILAPYGRDAPVAAAVLREAGLEAEICPDLQTVRRECEAGAGAALIVEEVLQEDDYAPLARWVESQPPWSDFPVIVLARRGGGLERNPAAERYGRALGNVSFLERPFHPTTLVSIVQTALRGRRRQYEARERLETLRGAIQRQQQDQSHLRLLINELNHRVKNTLATVQSIVTQTLRSGGAPLSTRDTLTARIVALSKAHDVLTNEQWSGADLGEIVAQALQPFRLGMGEERVITRGPKVRLEPKTAIAIALALHELATNAVKYGALSASGGRVEFEWSLSKGRAARELTATWREIDGPRVNPPTRTGFGTRLIERGLAADLNGEVRIDYPIDGVVCTIRARLDTGEGHEPFAAPVRSGPRHSAADIGADAAPPA